METKSKPDKILKNDLGNARDGAPRQSRRSAKGISTLAETAERMQAVSS